MSDRVLITGITGQDGSYLADLCLAKGHEVHGVVRRSSAPDQLWRINHLLGKVTLHDGDVLDTGSMATIVEEVKPRIWFHEADQDSVPYSKRAVGYTMDLTCAAVGKMLELVRQIDPAIRWFQPLSATMFHGGDGPLDETAPLDPRSPYACAKAAAWHLCRYFRKEHGMFVSCGILWNHDSERRRPGYLLQTIARSAVRIARGQQERLELRGSLDQVVDVGYAPEFVEGIYAMMQLDEPDDFVLSSNSGWGIGEIVRTAFLAAGVPWGAARFAKEPAPMLVGDCGKARSAFGWEPRSDAVRVVARLIRHFEGLPDVEPGVHS